jgi:hypothetical protein
MYILYRRPNSLPYVLTYVLALCGSTALANNAKNSLTSLSLDNCCSSSFTTTESKRLVVYSARVYEKSVPDKALHSCNLDLGQPRRNQRASTALDMCSPFPEVENNAVCSLSVPSLRLLGTS